MATIKNTAGLLSPPACYIDEQARFNAYVAALISTIVGGLQWEASKTAPVDLSLFWLKLDTDNRPRSIRKYSVADAKWVPVIELPFLAEGSGGAADTYTVSNSPAMASASLFAIGRRLYFIAAAANTGASTLNVDGLGAKPITKFGGVPLEAGDISQDEIVDVIYSTFGGGRWELQNQVPVRSVLPTYVTKMAAVPANGAVQSITHDGTKVPEFASVRMRCKDIDLGYAVDDEVELSSFFWTGTNTGIPAFVVTISSVSVTVTRPTTVTQLTLAPKGGGAAYPSSVTTTKWELVVRCTFLP